ncbi:Ankyrin_repeat protein 1 [Hexamita inflata]|uniref:Ankyrin repeat protein 1 n=1 Tax=Hexamita inflata TaxID=28002 RepID=A0AA86U864_9EUKA|nr:Ankyrin repeat protein 1 [Hexamita inflata]
MFEQMVKDCMPQQKWFDEAKNGNTKFINDNLYKYFGCRDNRKSDYNQEVFQGFTALAYACYFDHIDTVRALVDYELSIKIKNRQTISASGYDFSSITIPAGVTCFTISLLRQNIEIVKFLMSYIQSRIGMHERLVGYLQNGMNTYLYASICNYPEAFEILKNQLFIDRELHLYSNQTPLYNVVIHKQIKAVQIFADLAEDTRNQEKIYKMCLSLTNHNNILQVVDKNWEGYQLLYKLVYTAYHAMQKQHSTLCKRFLCHKPYSSIFIEPIITEERKIPDSESMALALKQHAQKIQNNSVRVSVPESQNTRESVIELLPPPSAKMADTTLSGTKLIARSFKNKSSEIRAESPDEEFALEFKPLKSNGPKTSASLNMNDDDDDFAFKVIKPLTIQTQKLTLPPVVSNFVQIIGKIVGSKNDDDDENLNFDDVNAQKKQLQIKRQTSKINLVQKLESAMTEKKPVKNDIFDDVEETIIQATTQPAKPLSIQKIKQPGTKSVKQAVKQDDEDFDLGAATSVKPLQIQKSIKSDPEISVVQIKKPVQKAVDKFDDDDFNL